MRKKNIRKTIILRHLSLLLVLAIVSVMLLIQGCCVPNWVIEKQYRRLDSGCSECRERMLSEIPPEEVSLALHQRVEQLRDFSGIRKVQLHVKGTTYIFSEVCLFKQPAFFRLEALGFLDHPVVFLLSDGQEMSAYSKTQNTFYHGRASQENIGILQGIPLSGEDMRLLSTGNPPLLANVDDEWGFYMPNERLYFLERRSFRDNIGQRIWVNIPLKVMVYLQEYHLKTGDILLDCSFEDYRMKDNDYPIPKMITIHSPQEEIHLRIGYRMFDVNHPLDNMTLFREGPVSRDATIYDLDEKREQAIEILAPYKEFRREE